MEFENLAIAQEGPIAIVTLNRPQRRNALSLELMLDLIGGLEEIGRRREIRAVILAAAGQVFCSGHDLSEMTGRDISGYRRIFDVCSELMTKVQAIPQPVIAEVQGLATAAGCQLVAACDLAIAAEEAAFATPGVKIGLFCTTPMVALTRAIGRKRALADAAHRRTGGCPHGRRMGPHQPGRARRRTAAQHARCCQSRGGQSVGGRLGKQASIPRSISTSPKPTPMRRK